MSGEMVEPKCAWCGSAVDRGFSYSRVSHVHKLQLFWHPQCVVADRILHEKDRSWERLVEQITLRMTAEPVPYVEPVEDPNAIDAVFLHDCPYCETETEFVCERCELPYCGCYGQPCADCQARDRMDQEADKPMQDPTARVVRDNDEDVILYFFSPDKLESGSSARYGMVCFDFVAGAAGAVFVDRVSGKHWGLEVEVEALPQVLIDLQNHVKGKSHE